jgi:2-polyprenyl-3-methyl-5-hydroxy-6-metoxy-1,4-benzoquinol methylase
MDSQSPKEKQYQFMLDMKQDHGNIEMTCRASSRWRLDPKSLGFTLARHKFVAKMLAGYPHVLEIGCGDGFASRVIHSEITELHGIDFDPLFINEAKDHADPDWPVTFDVHDILDGPFLRNNQKFDAAFSLDVIEHIHPDNERRYLENICLSIKPGGVFVCGAPSLESQIYASQASKEGHINCKSGKELKNLLADFFDHTFLFGMNDEVLHTGFSPMCHYLLVLAVGNKIS